MSTGLTSRVSLVRIQYRPPENLLLLTFWKCSHCGFLITAAMPPVTCPAYKEKCDFLNVTSHTLDCGGPDKIDPRL